MDRMGPRSGHYGLVVVPLALLALVVAVYVVGEYMLPRIVDSWLGTYVVRPLLWTAMAATTVAMWWRGGRLGPRFGGALVPAAMLVGAGQVCALVVAGVLLGFGHSPFDHSPVGLLINLVFVGTTLIGVELSRAFVLDRLGRGKSLVGLGLITVIFTIVNTPLPQLLGLAQGNAVQSIPFVASRLFPSLAENLLASYLALVGGPLAAIGYRGVLEAFEWFSPILPDLPWAVTALLGTTLPIAGFLLVEQPVAEGEGMESRAYPERSEEGQGSEKAEKSSLAGWLAVALVGLVALSLSLGLLPVHATLIGSGSMEPAMYLGDVAVVRKVSADHVSVGDVAQFRRGNVMVLHRVVETTGTGGARVLTTKGDNNNAPDSEPVLAQQVVGKVLLVIPKVGWVAIAARTPEGLALLVGLPVAALALVEGLRWRRRRQDKSRGLKVDGRRVMSDE